MSRPPARAIGQVNGLAVYDLGHHRFGRPSRITARVGLGREGVVNVERQAGLSGPTHDKGVAILTGFLRGTFARANPLSMACSITFEQSYGGIDGDSASSTEIYAILSALAELPIRQDVAVTGSVDQHGRVQAIGGVNEKIEGFFRVCATAGLSGSQGVMIPESNVADLHLNREVVDAVAQGRFHVWATSSIESGIELLTGTPAGSWDRRDRLDRGQRLRPQPGAARRDGPADAQEREGPQRQGRRRARDVRPGVRSAAVTYAADRRHRTPRPKDRMRFLLRERFDTGGLSVAQSGRRTVRTESGVRLGRSGGEMTRRVNTIIIVPHSKAKFIKISFATRSLVAGVVGSVALLALAIVAIIYSGTAVGRSGEVVRLESENHQLATVNQELEQTVNEVQARLDEFEQRAARLALAAGMDSSALDATDPEGHSDRVGRGGPYARVPDAPEQLALQERWIQERLDRVEEHFAEQAQRFASTPSVAPAMGIITDGFGRRRDPFTGRNAFHQGLDISARRGTDVCAPADGVVVFAGREGGFGRVIRISHGFGYTTVYGHLDKMLVKAGDEVGRGELIGLIGSSGRSTGPHLHYEVHVDGKAVNPLYYILDAF